LTFRAALWEGYAPAWPSLQAVGTPLCGVCCRSEFQQGVKELVSAVKRQILSFALSVPPAAAWEPHSMRRSALYIGPVMNTDARN
jgi:hypothetical protein